MTQTDSLVMKGSSSKTCIKINLSYQQKAKRSTIIIIFGCFLFFVSGILNFTDEYLRGWSLTKPFLGYLLFGFTVTCLVPIAIGIKEIVTISFADSSRKYAKQAFQWLLIYALTVLVNIIVMGWPIMAIFVSITIVFARILGFYFLSKAFKKIKYLSNLNVGGFLYNLYGVFYVIIATLGGLGSLFSDDSITNLVFIFNGIIESVLIILLSIKIVYDILLIRNFKIKGKTKESSIQKILERQKKSKF
ncbi:MAG: hypothetical protein HGN29_01805 [Asgard group archaeon]|nr:hypothetical protein [Asgard group archaeon]